VTILAQLLRPIKTAILLLEGNESNLADAFIQIVRLAYAIKTFDASSLITFQQHAIRAFNRRWQEFDISLYLLAYFLHPQFRSKYTVGRDILYRKVLGARETIYNNYSTCYTYILCQL
jgi:hypothetical protein